MRYWRETRRELTRNAAVVYTDTGLYGLLNYYGYALFFFHTLSAFSGQTASLPSRSIAFQPHFSAFDAASGEASVPVLLGGSLGALRLTSAAATLTMAFLSAELRGAPLSFISVRICQHSFTDGPYEFAAAGSSVTFSLPAPCNSSLPSSASTIASAAYCTAAPAQNASASVAWAQQLTQPLPDVTRDACLAFVASHRYCGYAFDAGASTCWPVPGAACYLVDGPPGPSGREVGFVSCNFTSAGYTPPSFVNTTSTAFYPNTSFAVGFTPLDSPVFSLVLPDFDACAALAARQQSCGYLWAPRYAGAALGSCGPGALDAGCCVLNPTTPASGGCAPGALLNPAVWGAGAVLGIFDAAPPALR